jgi:hypothetical protein
MPSGLQFGRGFQRLVDAQMRYVRNAHTVYLRLRNFPDLQQVSQAVQLGFALTPSGAGTNIGTQDIQIDPPPSVKMISIHNIGQSMGKLRFGARQFLISATFVERQVAQQGLTDQDLVFRGPNVVGLVVDNQLFSIENIAHEELAGHTVVWTLTCNAAETINPGIS